MPKTITPIDESLQVPDPIGDRSSLSSNYRTLEKKVELPTKANVLPEDTVQSLSIIDSIIINLLLIVPYVISYISIATIYSIGGNADVSNAALNRILIIFLGIPSLVPWVVAVHFLKKYFEKYQLSLFVFIIAYSLFLLPMISITMHFNGNSFLVNVLFLVTFTLSQVYLWLLNLSLRDKRNRWVRTVPPLTLLVVVMIAAIVQG